MPALEECYTILGVPPYTRKADVVEKYRLLVQVWHPDRFEQQRRIREQAEEHLKQITAAYKQIESAGFPDVPTDGGRPTQGAATARRLCRCPWCGVQNRLPADYQRQEVSCGGCKRPFRLDEFNTARRHRDTDSWTPSLVKCPSCAAPNWCLPEQMVTCATCGTFFSWN
jgi:hypothetical protein